MLFHVCIILIGVYLNMVINFFIQPTWRFKWYLTVVINCIVRITLLTRLTALVTKQREIHMWLNKSVVWQTPLVITSKYYQIPTTPILTVKIYFLLCHT